MTCCVVALALVWHLVAGWRRVRGWLGLPDVARRRPRTFGVAAANAVAWLRHPALRGLVLAVLALEAGAAGAYAYQHKYHIAREIGVAIHGVTGFARALCRGDDAARGRTDT